MLKKTINYLDRSSSILPELIAIALAFLISATILLITGYQPIRAFTALFRGAFGSKFAIGQTLTQATPILFTSLSFLLAFRSGIFNIGIEGQILIGAFTAAVFGSSITGLPPLIHVIISLSLGGIFGALWGLIPALLKIFTGASEVITTMMMSYIASHLTSYVVIYRVKAPGWVAQTNPVQPSAILVKILPPTQLSVSFLISLGFSMLVFYFFLKPIWGIKFVLLA